ncbi:MAG TPA: peptidylprolyl isomerase [Candidatus Angelobacter sp.]|nr:peptidylprolyl isomerase [Candidatus Angelobacter sp.]
MLFRAALILFILNVAAAAQTASPTAPQTKKAPAKGTTTTTAKAPQAILHTTAGEMKCELFPDKAPKAVDNFIGLATGKKDWINPLTGQKVQGKPLYDGVIFHRVIPGFMIQGGDPIGTGNGTPGYKFDSELHADLLFDRPGRLAMANSGANTNGSQFFITEDQRPPLNPCLEEAGCDKPFAPPNNHVAKGWGYTIFGQCDAATVALVTKIAQGPCRGRVCDGSNPRPDNPVKITHIEILNAPAAKPAPAKPSAAKPAAQPSAAKPAASPKPSSTPKQ